MPDDIRERHPVIAQKGAMPFAVEAGQTYLWCACGLSQTQPLCDGTHDTRSTLVPMPYTARKTGKVYFCGCKHSIKRPLCDGTHGKI